ncbi:MAG TPA: helix-turn-helix transcriptional regulator [Flavisolibacter sp.]|nr:helix-turn-helix transcriptional regulator [Flavisolibacter sp.]
MASFEVVEKILLVESNVGSRHKSKYFLRLCFTRLELYFTIKTPFYTFVAMSFTTERRNNIGRKIERIRELRGMKQETLAAALGISQQAVSKMEASEEIDEERLQKVAKALDVPVEAIKNFNEENAINIIANTVNNHDQSAMVFYNPTFNPIEKVVELYERLLKSEQEKVVILQSLINKGE